MTERQTIEEPCDAKVSRTVLKTIGNGNRIDEFTDTLDIEIDTESES